MPVEKRLRRPAQEFDNFAARGNLRFPAGKRVPPLVLALNFAPPSPWGSKFVSIVVASPTLGSEIHTQVLKSRVVSRGRCNTGLESTLRSFKAQRFARALIEAQRDLVQLGLTVAGQVGLLRQVLAQESIGVFVGAALPRTLRITEVHFDVRGNSEALVLGHLQPAVPGQRAPQRRRKLAHVLTQGGDYRSRVLAGHLDEHGETRTALHQGGNVTVACTAHMSAFCAAESPPRCPSLINTTCHESL